MNLQEFIKTTLVSIKSGLRDANVELAKQEGKELGNDFTSVFVMRPTNNEKSQSDIVFDVAVTVSQKDDKTGGGGIKIAVASLGGEINQSNSQENVTRIKFHISPFQFVS
jgi:hypothetical protein